MNIIEQLRGILPSLIGGNDTLYYAIDILSGDSSSLERRNVTSGKLRETSLEQSSIAETDIKQIADYHNYVASVCIEAADAIDANDIESKINNVISSHQLLIENHQAIIDQLTKGIDGRLTKDNRIEALGKAVKYREISGNGKSAVSELILELDPLPIPVIPEPVILDPIEDPIIEETQGE